MMTVCQTPSDVADLATAQALIATLRDELTRTQQEIAPVASYVAALFERQQAAPAQAGG